MSCWQSKNGREYLANGQRRRGVPAIEAKAFLQLRRHGILEPEEVKWLQLFAQARCLDGREPVMDVVQQVDVRAELLPQGSEEGRHEIEIALGAPGGLRGQAWLGRLVVRARPGNAVRLLDARNA